MTDDGMNPVAVCLNSVRLGTLGFLVTTGPWIGQGCLTRLDKETISAWISDRRIEKHLQKHILTKLDGRNMDH